MNSKVASFVAFGDLASTLIAALQVEVDKTKTAPRQHSPAKR